MHFCFERIAQDLSNIRHPNLAEIQIGRTDLTSLTRSLPYLACALICRTRVVIHTRIHLYYSPSFGQPSAALSSLGHHPRMLWK